MWIFVAKLVPYTLHRLRRLLHARGVARALLLRQRGVARGAQLLAPPHLPPPGNAHGWELSEGKKMERYGKHGQNRAKTMEKPCKKPESHEESWFVNGKNVGKDDLKPHEKMKV